jgi:hypothetical protein
MNIPEEGYSRNVWCTLKTTNVFIAMFVQESNIVFMQRICIIESQNVGHLTIKGIKTASVCGRVYE